MNTNIQTILFVLLLLCVTVAPSNSADQVLDRENIKTFSQDPTKLKKLRDAVDVLRKRKLDNSISWFTQAGIHDINTNDPDLSQVPPSIQQLFHQCHRDESLFFLWHRAYVAAVEKLMQDAIHDPTFRLPYWNWYIDPSLPEAFRNEFLDTQHTLKNPLYISDRNVNVNEGHPIWKPAVVTDFQEDFASFQDDLSLAEHGTIHVLVGTRTNMGDIHYAARDPIFYLHHANIDRLLMVWLRMNPNQKPPTNFPGWDSAIYRFPVSPGSIGDSNPPVHTPGEQELALGSMEAMGYKYDNVDPPSVSPPPLPKAPQHLQVAAAPNISPNQMKLMQFAGAEVPNKPLEIAAGGTVDLTVQANKMDQLKSLANMTPSPQAGGLSVVFENIQVKKPSPGLAGYQVFVNLPNEAPQTESFRDHFLGTLSLFNLQHTTEHGPATVVLRFSPRKGAAALAKSITTADKSKVSVSLVPILGPGATPPTAPVLTIGKIRLEGKLP